MGFKKSEELVVAARLVQTSMSASRRKKDFNLTMKYLSNILSQTHCAYSGEQFGGSESDSLTLERLNNDIGYIEGNVIAVKSKYNMVRSHFSLEEIIALRDEKAGRIVRAADHAKPVKTTPSEVVLPIYKKQYENIEANIKRRQEHMSQPGISAEVRKSLMARIAGGYSEMERLRRISLKKAASGGAVISNKASKAENAVHNYGIIIKGLQRFEKMSFIDKAKLKKGLPLEATIFQLIKGKM